MIIIIKIVWYYLIGMYMTLNSFSQYPQESLPELDHAPHGRQSLSKGSKYILILTLCVILVCIERIHHADSIRIGEMPHIWARPAGHYLASQCTCMYCKCDAIGFQMLVCLSATTPVHKCLHVF